tara:strand:- start:2 stop:526 length:525 start_codon:yes stop_codon:yes gene_type:complete
MVKDSHIDNSHEESSQWNIYAPHMDRWISPLGFIMPNDRHWDAFETYVTDVYGLEWELIGEAWKDYLGYMVDIIKQLGADDEVVYEYKSPLRESIQKSFYINELVGKTMIRLNENLNSKIHDAVSSTFRKNKRLKGQHKITRYFMKHYGLDKWEADQAMVQYLSKQQSMNEKKL